MSDRYVPALGFRALTPFATMWGTLSLYRGIKAAA